MIKNLGTDTLFQCFNMVNIFENYHYTLAWWTSRLLKNSCSLFLITWKIMILLGPIVFTVLKRATFNPFDMSLRRAITTNNCMHVDRQINTLLKLFPFAGSILKVKRKKIRLTSLLWTQIFGFSLELSPKLFFSSLCSFP